MPLRLVPVLDVKAGRGVRAMGGDPDQYNPGRSVLNEVYEKI